MNMRVHQPLLDERGARVILGSQPGAPVAPIAPSRSSLFAPRGACLGGPRGPLFVCDTGHHRVLVWNGAPATDGEAADTVIGQPDFTTEGRGMLNVPTGVHFAEGILALADTWNHRVLLWHGWPKDTPDVVISGDLFWPCGVTLHEGALYVADTRNRRVLAWDRVPEENRPADRVVREGIGWPHAIAFPGGRMYVADASVRSAELNMPYGATALGDSLVIADTGNSRLVAPSLGLVSGRETWPAGRASLCWPYSVAACGDTLVIADTGNNRVLLWDRA